MKPCPNCRLANPDSAQTCDCGYDFAAGVVVDAQTKKDHLKKPIAKVLVWIAGLVAFAVGRFAPIPVFMAFGGMWLAALISKKLRFDTQPLHMAFIVQAGLLFALTAGAFAAAWLGVDITVLVLNLVILLSGLVWLVTRPGTVPVVLLTLFQLVSIIANVSTLISATEATSAFTAAGILAVILRAASIWYLITGLRMMRKVPSLVRPANGDGA